MAISEPRIDYQEADLLELTNSRLTEILEERGIEGYTRRTLKKTLIEAILGQVREEDVDLSLFTQYQVRYVGVHHQQIIHNSNSTPTGKEYTFPRGAWVVVDQKDYVKYDIKIKRAIVADVLPDWEVRRQNPISEKVVNFYKSALEALRLTRKPRTLSEMRLLSEDHVIKLEGFNVRTIQQLIAMPEDWVAQTLRVDTTKALKIMQEGKAALRSW